MNNTETKTEERFDEAEFARGHYLVAEQADLAPTEYPVLRTLPIGLVYSFSPIPDEMAGSPEYVCIKLPEDSGIGRDEYCAYTLFVCEWNMNWESGRIRKEMLDNERRPVPAALRWVLAKDVDVRLVYQNRRHNYDQFSTLYHLLPQATLKRFGLPCLRAGGWPSTFDHHLLHNVLPRDFNTRFEEAMTFHLWPFLGSRCGPTAFSKEDPIKMLSHNLDYWLPHVDSVAQDRVRRFFGRVPFDDTEQKDLQEKYQRQMPPGIRLERPRYGGDVWSGEEDARFATEQMVEIADERGDLRAILDAIRSHRVADDFSARWSFEREDFERKLYSKRNKVKIAFVELDETIPVHNSASEVHENLLWEDFFAVLDSKEKRIVVCLRNGETRLGDIGKRMGYSNHSAVSKALARIRRKAKQLLC
jgi:hypothetical protein